MTMSPSDDGVSAQILIKLGDIAVSLAVIQKTLEAIPDHENRLRALERWRWGLPASVVAAGGSGVAAWLAYLHR